MKITAKHILIGVNPTKDNPRGENLQPGEVCDIKSKTEAEELIASGAATEGGSNKPADPDVEPKKAAHKKADNPERREAILEALNSLDTDNESMFTEAGVPRIEIVQQLDDRMADVSEAELAIAWKEMRK